MHSLDKFLKFLLKKKRRAESLKWHASCIRYLFLENDGSECLEEVFFPYYSYDYVCINCLIVKNAIKI